MIGRLFIAMIRFYRRYISPLTPPSCRFRPTCSQYAIDVIRIHGAIKGSILAIWRILRCGPWHPGGYDPAPRKGEWTSRPQIEEVREAFRKEHGIEMPKLYIAEDILQSPAADSTGTKESAQSDKPSEEENPKDGQVGG